MEQETTHSVVIPPQQGILEYIPCKGVASWNEEQKSVEFPLHEPVVAQVTSFSNGMRKICCPLLGFLKSCKASDEKQCVYVWKE